MVCKLVGHAGVSRLDITAVEHLADKALARKRPIIMWGDRPPQRNERKASGLGERTGELLSN
eukprot:scaffold338618_cov15-Prasinocladus_malaysianus.AAC.1